MKLTHYLFIIILVIFPFIIPSYNQNLHLDTVYWNKPIYFSPFEYTKVMLWNNDTEVLSGGEYCGLEKYKNGEWEDVKLHFASEFNSGFPAIGHEFDPDTEFVWGHTFPSELFMPGKYRIWREVYPNRGEIGYLYAEFYYAGSILTLSSILIFIIIIFSSKMKSNEKLDTSINFLFFMYTLNLLHFLYGEYISDWNMVEIYQTLPIPLIMFLVSFRFFDKTSRSQWRKEDTSKTS